MPIRARVLASALAASLLITVIAHAAVPGSVRRATKRPVPQGLLDAALARRGLTLSQRRLPGTGATPLSVTSTVASCGAWSYVNDGGNAFARYSHAIVYDSARDRLLILGGSDANDNLWSLTLGASPTLTQIETSGWDPNIPAWGMGAIYDPVRDRVVVCGGSSPAGNSTFTTPLYQLTLSGTPTWSGIDVSDGDAPVWHYEGSAIYDATRDRLVMFAGNTGDSLDNSVWTLNFSGAPTWSRMSPTGTRPIARTGQSAVYDGARDQMVVFGGGDANSTVLNDVWTLSLAGAGAWTHVTTSGGPPAARWYHNAVVDVPRNRMLLFSGEDSQLNPMSDVWRLSLTSPIKWTQISATGNVDLPQAPFASLYDPARQTMVSSFGDEFFELGNLSGTPAWTQVNPPGQPPLERDGSVAIYDAPRNRMVMFGGMRINESLPSRDLWSLTLADSTWHRLIPSGTPPPPRQYASGIFDPTGNRMILFGGATNDINGPSPVPLNDTWQLSLSGTPTWTHLNPGGSDPPVRYAHTAILDAPRNRVVLYGGADALGNALSDVWALALSGGTTWSHLNPTGGPAPAREFHPAVFDAPRNRMLTFGWNDATVWALGLVGTPSWSALAPAGTAPPAWVGHQAAYDAVRDRMLVSYDGTYALTLSGTPTWGQVGSPDPVLSPASGASSVYDTGRDRWLIYAPSGSAVYALSFPPTYALNVSASPANSGSVSTVPSGDCPPAGTQVQLTATAAAGYGFVGWSGDASGNTNPLTITMTGNKNVVANFANYPLTTSVSPAGAGAVARNPDLTSYPAGSSVTLTASALTGFAFDHWSGDASGNTNPLNVTMDGPKTIVANYTGFPVNVTISPPGAGTVTRNPDQPGYPPGSQVVLTASSNPYAFLGWSGDASGGDNPLTVTVDAAKNITANFDAFTVTVTAAPPSGGSVTRSPSQSNYARGTAVTLTAAPSENDGFVGWSGDTSGTENPLSLTVYKNRNIVANFAVPTPACGAWTPIASDTVPSRRYGNAAAWDPVRHRILMYGGWGYAPYLQGDYRFLYDVWAMTPAGGWTLLAPTGSITGYVSSNLIYDPDGDRMLMLNGWSRGGLSPYSNSYVWQLTLSGTPAWSIVSTTGSAPGWMGSAAIYDPIRHRVVVFGGQDVAYPYLRHNEVWALSLTGGTPTWTQLAPSGTPPVARQGHVGVYDSARDRLLVFGGNDASGNRNDVWALSLSGTPTWSQLSSWQTPPSGRNSAAATYDPVRDRMLLMGGTDGSVTFDETWSLSLKTQPTWRKLSPGGVALGSRSSFPAVYDPDDDLISVMDGHGPTNPDGLRSDSKRLDCAGGWWLESGADYGGTVTANPLKNCYSNGQVVNITATGWNNNPLVDWLGDLSGSNPNETLTMNGNKTIFAQFPEAPVAVEDPVLPSAFALEAIRPNPNPGPVALTYALPREAHVRLCVYDLAGRKVAELVNGMEPAGRHVATWSGASGQAPLRTGIYLARFETPAGVWTRRIALIR